MMLKFISAAAIGAAVLLFGPSPAAHAQATCSEAYASCSRVCSGGHFFGGKHPGQCVAHCTGQRARCMRTGSFRHIGNSWMGLRRS
jgi:hypothetical protein